MRVIGLIETVIFFALTFVNLDSRVIISVFMVWIVCMCSGIWSALSSIKHHIATCQWSGWNLWRQWWQVQGTYSLVRCTHTTVYYIVSISIFLCISCIYVRNYVVIGVEVNVKHAFVAVSRAAVAVVCNMGCLLVETWHWCWHHHHLCVAVGNPRRYKIGWFHFWLGRLLMDASIWCQRACSFFYIICNCNSDNMSKDSCALAAYLLDEQTVATCNVMFVLQMS